MITASSTSNLIKNMAVDMPETQSPQQSIRICSVRQASEHCRTFCTHPATLCAYLAGIAFGGGMLTFDIITKASVSSTIGTTAGAALVGIPMGALIYKGMEAICKRAFDALNDRDFRNSFVRGMPKADQANALKEFKLINSLPKYSVLEERPPSYEDTLPACELEETNNQPQLTQPVQTNQNSFTAI